MDTLLLGSVDHMELPPSTGDKQHPHSFFCVLGSAQTSATPSTMLGQTHSAVLESFDRVVNFAGSQTMTQVPSPSFVNRNTFMRENSSLKDVLVGAEVLATSMVLNYPLNMLDSAKDNILNKLDILVFQAVQTTLLIWEEEISKSGGDLIEGMLIQ